MNLFKKFQFKFFRFSFKNISLLLFTWLLIVFSLGTLTLLGPARWIVNLCKSLELSQSIESLSIKILIVLLVVVSFYLSLLICKMMIRRWSLPLNVSTMALLLIVTSAFVWLWLNPSVIQMGNREITEEKVGGVEFVFGPYPTKDELLNLKEEGYTAIISLLHPAVVPFEPKLISDEEEAVKLAGIQLLHIPMLPWVSDNKSSIEEIKSLAQNGKGKYYVHCYLGKDRVNVVKRIIRQFGSSIVGVNADSKRKLNEINSFERGEIIQLDKDVYLTPYPTDDEFFGFILNGNIKQIVSLLNPDHPPDTMWINKEQRILESHLMPYELRSVKLEPYDANYVLDIANNVKQMSGPVLVHGFLSKSPQTDAFISAFKTGLPSLPSELFERIMRRGRSELIAPNILIGPAPVKSEFKNYLYFKGIRKILFLGNERLASAIYDRLAAQDAGLEWYAIEEFNADVLKTLKSGGPWYVYGLSNDELAGLLRDHQSNIDDLLRVSY